MASHGATPADEQGSTRRERPWLIPSNRKLRHLRGITLRNLALSQPTTRSQTKTIDDEALPYTLKSPAKILALREGQAKLNHSHSSGDLRPIHEAHHGSKEADIDGQVTKSDAGQPNGSPRTPPRPAISKMRRRSTMEWAGASPQQRQRKMEDVSATRMADIFFSVHVTGIEEPVYVSEVVERAMNPNFRHLDFDTCGPDIMRLDSLSIKFWIRSERMQEYQPLLEMTLSLRSLQFIGKSLANFHHPFPHNCIIFELTDGFYTCFTDAQVDEPANPFEGAQAKAQSTRALPTSSFDALLRLSKLDDSIQDALALQKQLSSDLDHIVRSNKDALAEKDRVGEQEDFLKTVHYAKATVEKQVKVLQRKRSEKLSSLQTRRDLLSEARKAHQDGQSTLSTAPAAITALRDQHHHLKSAITNQRRRIAEDIQKIYPIQPLVDRTLSFTIRNLHLPNSEELDSEPPDVVAAALGHVAHVVQLLSFYLALPLPYPVTARGSTSTIYDGISVMPNPNTSSSSTSSSSSKATSIQQRTFPLFPKAAPRFRFEYAVFLLNKDIELLLSSRFGVRVLDIRHTLPNLLLVLSCATAGEGELPARKAGGVRGLLRAGRSADADGNGKVLGSGGASMPRSDSQDSGMSGRGFWGRGMGREGAKLGAIGSLERNKVMQESKLRGGG